MGKYLYDILIFSSVAGIVSKLAYNGKGEKAVRFSASILILAVILAPLVSGEFKLKDLDIKEYISSQKPDIDTEGAYLESAEKAFCSGVKELLSEKYGISAENLDVRLENFNFSSMSAERIIIILKKGALAADFRAIENYVRNLGLGDCVVEMSING